MVTREHAGTEERRRGRKGSEKKERHKTEISGDVLCAGSARGGRLSVRARAQSFHELVWGEATPPEEMRIRISREF